MVEELQNDEGMEKKSMRGSINFRLGSVYCIAVELLFQDSKTQTVYFPKEAYKQIFNIQFA